MLLTRSRGQGRSGDGEAMQARWVLPWSSRPPLNRRNWLRPKACFPLQAPDLTIYLPTWNSLFAPLLVRPPYRGGPTPPHQGKAHCVCIAGRQRTQPTSQLLFQGLIHTQQEMILYGLELASLSLSVLTVSAWKGAT